MKSTDTQSPAKILSINVLGLLQVTLVVGEAQHLVHCLPASANLLACLAVQAPGILTRSKLIALLYPDHGQTQGRRTLTDALYRLNSNLENALQLAGQNTYTAEDWISSDAETIQLNLSNVQLDALQFGQLSQSSKLEDWERALALQRGELLDGMSAQWLEAFREPQQMQYLALLESTCTALIFAGRLKDALAVTQRWLLADPLREEAHIAAIRLYARQRRYAEAFQQYDSLARVLKDELNIEPMPEARALIRAIHAESVALAREEATPTASPFVGRKRERTDLIRATEQAMLGQGGLVLVEGESGIGKTRLLKEVSDGAQWRGLTPAWGTAQQFAGTTPCAPLGRALQVAMSGAALEVIRAALSPASLELLSGLVPALRRSESPSKATPTDATPSSNLTIQHVGLADAVAEGFRTLAQLGPQLIVLDDVQWADTSLWAALMTAAPQLAHQRILLVLCYRTAEMRQNTGAWQAVQALDTVMGPLRIHLNGLTTQECAQLAFELGKPISPEAAANLQRATQGKPLFVEGLITGTPPDGSASVSSFQTVFEDKLISLTPQARNALEAAAVLGREFSPAAWQAAAGADVVLALPTLKHLKLVTDSERGYRFPHDYMHEQVYNAIGPQRMRELHRRAAAALWAERAEPAILAWHYEQAGQWQDAVRYHRIAGEQAESAYAHASALEHYARGFNLLNHLEPKREKFDRLRLLCNRQLIYGMELRLPEWRKDIEMIESLAAELKLPAGLITALEARMTLALFASDMAGIRMAGDRALALAKASHNPHAEARIANILGMHLANQLGHAARARKLLQGAVAYASAVNHKPMLISSLCNLSGAQRFYGECNEARENALHALTLSQINTHLNAARANALLALGCAEWYLARWQVAHTTLMMAIQLHNQLNNAWPALDATLNFTFLNAQMGDYDAAIAALQQLQGLARRVGLSAEADLWKWSEALLADVYVLAGEHDKAAQVLRNMADWMRAASDGRQLLAALQAQGRLLLEQGQPSKALTYLERAKCIWQHEQTVQVEPLLLHALAAYGVGDVALAQASLKLAEQCLHKSDVVLARVQLLWVRFVVLADGPALSRARDELHRQAAQFDDNTLRARFLNQVQLHRQIETAWQAQTQATQVVDANVHQIIVRLVRAAVPLGKKLTDADRTNVVWTLDAGAPDARLLQQKGKVTLRQHRIKRLLTEANAQGAAPTDEDVANALGVTLRTVERDMAALGDAVKGMTRRRK